MRCFPGRYSRVWGGKIDFSSGTPPRERKGDRVSRPFCSLSYRGVAGKGVSNPQTGQPGPTCSFPKTDWRGAVNTNRWLSLSSETSLLAAALEKYDPISALALPLRQTCDVCPGDIRAFWAGKSPFRAERHRETETGDWLAEKIGFELLVAYWDAQARASGQRKQMLIRSRGGLGTHDLASQPKHPGSHANL